MSAPNSDISKVRLQRVSTQPENPFISLIDGQRIAIVPSFTLESGHILYNIPIAFKFWGRLSENGDNCLVVCHALSGSADVADWWGPLLGQPGRAFDVTRFFIISLNALGSCYGSASPVTNRDGDSKRGRYGPEFPLTTIRDDVNIHKIVLDDLGVKQIAAVVGGSMGGMHALEYAYFGPEYVKSIAAIATSARHSAWGIAWGESQRQSIYSDPKYDDGYYSFDDPPSTGLGAARMQALLTYRSRDSFESRFGRNTSDKSRNVNETQRPTTPSNEHWATHNDGHKNARAPRPSNINSNTSPSKTPPSKEASITNGFTDPQIHGATILTPPTPPPAPPPTPLNERKRAATYFSAQSYLRYQGDKFVKRFDSNCYIAITRKLDTHDVSRHRIAPENPNAVALALAQIQQPVLVIGIESDGLFTFAEQEELASAIPDSRLRKIESPEGHDAFLLQFEQVNAHVLEFFHEKLPDIMTAPGQSIDVIDSSHTQDGVGNMTKTSTFGEAEVGDITAW